MEQLEAGGGERVSYLSVSANTTYEVDVDNKDRTMNMEKPGCPEGGCLEAGGLVRDARRMSNGDVGLHSRPSLVVHCPINGQGFLSIS